MESVRVENCVPFTSNLHSVAFININFICQVIFHWAIESRSVCKRVESHSVLTLR